MQACFVPRHLPNLYNAYMIGCLQEDVAERCFDLFNHCGLVLEVAPYLYSIQIQAYLHPCYLPHIAPLYSHPPSQVVDSVLSMKAEMCPTNVAKMLDMVEVYQSRLADWRQASMLTELVPVVKMPQFSADGEYRREIIMELVRSLSIAISFHFTLALVFFLADGFICVFYAHLTCERCFLC